MLHIQIAWSYWERGKNPSITFKASINLSSSFRGATTCKPIGHPTLVSDDPNCVSLTSHHQVTIKGGSLQVLYKCSSSSFLGSTPWSPSKSSLGSTYNPVGKTAAGQSMRLNRLVYDQYFVVPINWAGLGPGGRRMISRLRDRKYVRYSWRMFSRRIRSYGQLASDEVGTCPEWKEEEIMSKWGEKDSLRPFPWGLRLYYAIPPIQSMVIMVHHPISPATFHLRQYNIKKSNISHELMIVSE